MDSGRSATATANDPVLLPRGSFQYLQLVLSATQFVNPDPRFTFILFLLLSTITTFPLARDFRKQLEGSSNLNRLLPLC